MGGQNSKEGFSASLNVFTTSEKESINTLFKSVYQEKKTIASAVLLVNLGNCVTKDFCERFCRAAALTKNGISGETVDLASFAKSLAILLKGDNEERSEFWWHMIGQSNVIACHHLKKFFHDVAAQFLITVERSEEFHSWKFKNNETTVGRLVQMYFFDIFQKCKTVREYWENDDTTSFTESEIVQKFSKDSLLSTTLIYIFANIFPVLETQPGCPIPKCIASTMKNALTLLDLPSVLMLNKSVPVNLNKSWDHLYSTSCHGESFSTLLGAILKKGPTVIVLKDKEGHIFGGFSSESWELIPRFVGTEDCFVFTLSPELAVYSSTGYNTNYRYLCLHQHTLPNGMGFGGQLNNFGLWIDHEFEGGHSTPACSSYSSPQLSASRQFKLDELEAWLVGPPIKVDEEVPQKSILDSDVGAKALLVMINKVGASDGVREEDQQLEKHKSQMDKK